MTAEFVESLTSEVGELRDEVIKWGVVGRVNMGVWIEHHRPTSCLTIRCCTNRVLCNAYRTLCLELLTLKDCTRMSETPMRQETPESVSDQTVK